MATVTIWLIFSSSLAIAIGFNRDIGHTNTVIPIALGTQIRVIPVQRGRTHSSDSRWRQYLTTGGEPTTAPQNFKPSAPDFIRERKKN